MKDSSYAANVIYSIWFYLNITVYLNMKCIFLSEQLILM